MATLRDVAKKAKVSLSTASRVVNGQSYICEEKRQRVWDAVKDLNYTYIYREHSRRNTTIGILLSMETGRNIAMHPTVHVITMGIVQKCNDEKIMNSMMMIDLERSEAEAMFLHPLDGYVLVGTSKEEEDAVIPVLKSKRIPFVVVNRWLEDRHISYVNIDDYNAVREAVIHMAREGHRKIGLANGKVEMRNSQQRLEGFLAGCQEMGVQIRNEWIFHGKYDEENGRKVAYSLSRMQERPTLMMTSSDIIAIGLIRGLKEKTIHVPEDISVMGFGDISEAAYFQPSLTTIRMPSLEMGREAVSAVLRMLQNPTICHVKIALDCERIDRESTRNRVE